MSVGIVVPLARSIEPVTHRPQQAKILQKVGIANRNAHAKLTEQGASLPPVWAVEALSGSIGHPTSS
jgi:hypothetical protein